MRMRRHKLDWSRCDIPCGTWAPATRLIAYRTYKLQQVTRSVPVASTGELVGRSAALQTCGRQEESHTVCADLELFRSGCYRSLDSRSLRFQLTLHDAPSASWPRSRAAGESRVPSRSWFPSCRAPCDRPADVDHTRAYHQRSDN